MTLTIEVAPETESRLALKARQQGLTLPDYARRVLEHDAEGAQEATTATNGHSAELTPRQQAARRLRGSLKGLVSSDELIRQRREEATREMEATAARTAAKVTAS